MPKEINYYTCYTCSLNSDGNSVIFIADFVLKLMECYARSEN